MASIKKPHNTSCHTGQIPKNRTGGEHCVDLVPYSRKPFTQFSPSHSMGIKKNTHAVRGIKNKKSGECFKIRNLK
jgi:hypothetical protein